MADDVARENNHRLYLGRFNGRSENFPTRSVVRPWNWLPTEVVAISTLGSFHDSAGQ